MLLAHLIAPMLCYLPMAQSTPLPKTADARIVDFFSATTRGTTWNQTRKIHLNFQTFHPQGLAITPSRIFLSSVEILEATVPYAEPRDGLDRTPGKGVGHVFVLDYNGKLVHDIRLSEGYKYHPGGIDFDGENIWIPLAEYRPNSSASIYRIDAKTLEVRKQFDANDHYGGIVLDRSRNQLVGNNWASRNFTAWEVDSTVVEKWANQNFFVDFQDCQYIDCGKAICSGVASLPYDPRALAALGGNAQSTMQKYELGGVSLIDLHSHAILHEVPVSKWSKNDHAITRNPMKLLVQDEKLTMWAAPDDGTETGGTDLLVFEAH